MLIAASFGTAALLAAAGVDAAPQAPQGAKKPGASAKWPQGTSAKPAGKAPVGAKVDYKRDVLPLLKERCYACHGNGMKLGGLSLESRAAMLKGGQTGPTVVPGHGEASLLVRLVSGADPNRVMPARGKRLTHGEIATIEAWVDQGMSFGDAKQVEAWTPLLAPRRPAVPPANPALGLTNPIDRLLQSYFKAHKLTPGKLVDDRTFARRAYLDLIGLLPTPEQLDAFLADKRPDKRARLADQLLADNTNYAEHWLTFWNDMLRNDYTGTGYIDGGRRQITGWLMNALATNLPFDKFVQQLVNPTPESEGFVNGIVWRGVVNASQTPQMQAAQNISQVFMGVNLKCASCHDSFVSTWKLTDSYGMAGIYADKPLETVRCDRPTGTIAPIKFLYPELGKIDSGAPRAQRMAELAAILTAKTNGRLARTFVNRLWQKLMGRGLVEPLDEMDNRPWDPDVLDWLAADFSDHGYDVKHTLREIVTSRAYQLPAMGLKSEQVEDFAFTGPVMKRMTAEQFCDAISQLTGAWEPPAQALRIAKGMVVPPQGKSVQVRYGTDVLRSGAVDIDVDVSGAQVLTLVATDAGDNANSDWTDWCDPRLEGPGGTVKLTSLKWESATTGYGTIQLGKSVVEKPLVLGDKTYADGIGTHANSIISYLLPPGKWRFRCTAGPDANGVANGKGVTSIRLFVLTSDRSLVDARASMAIADPLMVALGRPNREQVVTERQTVATTLQALELTNGPTLEAKLEAGADRWSREGKAGPAALVRRIYEAALGRAPTPAEATAAAALVGSPVRKDGVEDLLWSLTMLPEFQLVY